MKLIADAMLGRLAKWLRLLGYDTAYMADADVYAVLRSARAEGRLILTRNRDLAARKGVRVLLIDSGALNEQLGQVHLTLGEPGEPGLPRCSECNQILHDLPKERAVKRVPPFIHKKHRRFKTCPECHRVYWPGSHWERIEKKGDSLHDATGSDTMAGADDRARDLDS